MKRKKPGAAEKRKGRSFPAARNASLPVPSLSAQSALTTEAIVRMPAEWEPHQATWLSWPHELTDWPGKFSPIPWAFAEIVRHLARVERVFLLVENRAAEARVREILRKSGTDIGAVDFFRVPTDRSWLRDSGPIGVVAARPHLEMPSRGDREIPAHEEASLALLNFAFNGWAKYGDHQKDARIVARASGRLGRRVIRPEHRGRRVVLEGGSIDVNGLGTLLTTEECLLGTIQERNPGFTKGTYDEIFRRYMDITNVIWLKRGIAGDDTHGHVDDLARFVGPNTVVTALEDNPADVNYEPLVENLALLKAAKDQDGCPLRVETLPMPAPIIFDGQRLPASYANFYVANKIVLVPLFNDPADRIALDKLAALFPDREIVPIYCRDLVLGLGTIHCMTQQLPLG